MKPWLLPLPLLTAFLVCVVSAAEPPIDWNRAQQLHQRAQRGEKLTPEEQNYYDRAKAARAKGGYVVAAAHIAFPGLGRVRANGMAYTWVPVNYGVVR